MPRRRLRTTTVAAGCLVGSGSGGGDGTVTEPGGSGGTPGVRIAGIHRTGMNITNAASNRPTIDTTMATRMSHVATINVPMIGPRSCENRITICWTEAYRGMFSFGAYSISRLKIATL